MKELKDVYRLPGMLTYAEVDYLYHLGQFNQREGAIVEIGSWKGKSTIALALGAAKVHSRKDLRHRSAQDPSFSPTSNKLASTTKWHR